MEGLFSDVAGWLSKPALVQVFTVVLATVVANFVARYLLRQLLAKAEQSHTIWDDAFVGSIHQPLSLLIWVIGISWAAEVVSFEAQAGLAEIIEPIRFICVVGLITMFLSKFVSSCEDGFIANGTDVTTAHAIGKLLRISVFITAALTVLQTLGISISGILAFGGVGGIAVGFAAKDLLANFFGGLVIYLDRPFAVGDWIRSPDRDIEGTVEKIGWRLTIIR
ncbi:MAG: mechanosensitive ion channel, partial [Pseudomonadales bacterium]|nr:mechanosensitive ion channel [Pseudomonadales bacterium]